MDKKSLGSFTLAMIAISAILNVRELPIMASTGWQSVFFFLLAAITFLIPSAIVSAKLAAKFPENGGLYTWIKHAFGRRAGSAAIWMEWINNIIVYPATLATILTTAAYIGFPSLAHNRMLLFSFMMVILWGLIGFNTLRIGFTSRLNIFGALFGTLLPCALIIIIGLVFMSKGMHSNLPPISHHLLPTFNSTGMAFFIGVLSSYGGMQIIAFHASNVKHPKKTFPRAIFIATTIIIAISIFATLAIAFIIPTNKINIMNGLIEGVSAFMNQIHLHWLVPIFAGLIAFGSLASMNAWVIGPARGMQDAAANGDMPRFLAKTNKNEMPTRILLIQGVIGTLLASFFLWMPSIKSAFWVLIALMSQFTLLVYIIMFFAAIKLLGKSIVTVFGITSCAIGFYLGLFPPAQIHWQHEWTYISMMLLIDGVIIAVPLLYWKNLRRVD